MYHFRLHVVPAIVTTETGFHGVQLLKEVRVSYVYSGGVKGSLTA